MYAAGEQRRKQAAALAEADRATEEMVSLCRARARLRMRGQNKRALQIWQMLAQASRVKRQCQQKPTCQAKETSFPRSDPPNRDPSRRDRDSVRDESRDRGAAEAPSRRKKVPECTRATEGGSTKCQKKPTIVAKETYSRAKGGADGGPNRCQKRPTIGGKETHCRVVGANARDGIMRTGAEVSALRLHPPPREGERKRERQSDREEEKLFICTEPQPPRAGVEGRDHSALGECGEYLLCEEGGDRFGKALRQALAAVRVSGCRSLSVCLYIHT